MTRAHARLAMVLLACAVTGCADPYERQQRARRTADPAQTVTPGPPAGPISTATPTLGRSPRATSRAFAERWVNWDWRSASTQQRALARLATGSLAAQLRASARSSDVDASLRRDTPGVRGTVAAISLRTRSRRANGLIVTREQTYTAGRADLGGRRYRVYRIKLAGTSRGWEVSAWQPQP